MCVCVSVCLSVCVCRLYSPHDSTDLDENPHKYSLGCLPVRFFSNFENFYLMTSWRPFWINSFRHSHGSKLASIFFKFAHDVAYILALFAIENQQDREISSIQNGVPRIGSAAILEPKINMSLIVNTKGRFYIDFDPLNNNLTFIGQFEKNLRFKIRNQF